MGQGQGGWGPPRSSTRRPRCLRVRRGRCPRIGGNYTWSLSFAPCCTHAAMALCCIGKERIPLAKRSPRGVWHFYSAPHTALVCSFFGDSLSVGQDAPSRTDWRVRVGGIAQACWPVTPTRMAVFVVRPAARRLALFRAYGEVPPPRTSGTYTAPRMARRVNFMVSLLRGISIAPCEGAKGLENGGSTDPPPFRRNAIGALRCRAVCGKASEDLSTIGKDRVLTARAVFLPRHGLSPLRRCCTYAAMARMLHRERADTSYKKKPAETRRCF